MPRMKDRASRSGQFFISAAKSGALALVIAFASHAPASADAYFDYGLRMYQARNFKQAIQYFDTRLKLVPGDANAVYYKALCYQQLRDVEKAKQIFQQIVSEFGGTKPAQLADAALKQIAAAEEAVEKAKAEAEKAKDNAAQNKNDKPGATKTASASPGGRSSSGAGSKAPSAAEANSEDDDSERPLVVPPNAKAYFSVRPGHNDIIVEGMINGRRTQFCFDTGAHGTFMSKAQLQAMGIRPPSGPPTGKGQGVGGAVDTWTMKANVTVGGITQRVPIMIAEEYDLNPLLGQDFFKDVEYEIDNKGHCIYFRKARDLTGDPKQDQYAIPFRKKGRHLVVDVEGEGGKSTSMIVDTGAEGIVFTPKNAKELGMTIPEDAVEETHMGVGGTSQGYGFYVNSIRLGPIVMRNTKVTVMSGKKGTWGDEKEGLTEGLLGQDFFGSWRFTIDNKNNRLRFFH